MPTTISVSGMSCEGCEEIVEKALSDHDRVASVTADSESDTVTVEGDADVDRLLRSIDFAGYDAERPDEEPDE